MKFRKKFRFWIWNLVVCSINLFHVLMFFNSQGVGAFGEVLSKE